MASTPQNAVDALNRNQSRVPLPVTTNLTINEGDFVYWDATNFTITPITNKSQITGTPPTTFVGMALQSNANLVYPNDPDQVGLLCMVRGVVWAFTTAAETYNWFTPVTVSTASPQTITTSGAVSTVGSSYNIVGVTLPPVATSPRASQATPVSESLTGASGVRVQVALIPSNLYAAAV